MTGRPRLLDLFCGAGGCSVGYHQAGFDVVGVDIVNQPRYPFEFHQADALTYPLDGFDVIHASPPCQRFSEATPMQHRGDHADLIAPTRERLLQTARPFIIENVENARQELRSPVLLCGSMLGLPIWRHRYFEISPCIGILTPPCNHKRHPITVHSGSHTRKTWIPVLCTGGGDGKRAQRKLHRPRERVGVVRWAMEIDWMVQSELTQAIPPAYTEFIGKQLIQHLRRKL